MGVSIYYDFTSEKNLEGTGALSHLSDQWDIECGDDLYESWTWYDTEKEDNHYVYSGSTKMPLDERSEFFVMKAVQLLSELRSSYGGDDWSLNLDDFEIPWDEDQESFLLE